MNFLKTLGIGLVIIVFLPALIVIAALIGVIMLFEWVVFFFKGTIRFFKGDTFFKPLPEDEEVKRIKAINREKQMGTQPEQPAPAPQPTQQNVYVTNYYQYPGQGQQAPQSFQQGNPYLNNSPQGAIPEKRPDFIDQDCQELSYSENGTSNEYPAIEENKGGYEQ